MLTHHCTNTDIWRNTVCSRIMQYVDFIYHTGGGGEGRRRTNFESTPLTLIRRRYNVMCPVSEIYIYI